MCESGLTKCWSWYCGELAHITINFSFIPLPKSLMQRLPALTILLCNFIKWKASGYGELFLCCVLQMTRQIINVWVGESFLLNNYVLCEWRNWSALAESFIWGPARLRWGTMTELLEISARLHTVGRPCQCQTDQLSADQCSSHYPLLLGHSQVINWDDGTDSKGSQVIDCMFVQLWGAVLKWYWHKRYTNYMNT